MTSSCTMKERMKIFCVIAPGKEIMTSDGWTPVYARDLLVLIKELHGTMYVLCPSGRIGWFQNTWFRSWALAEISL